mgnify:FL=1
MWIGRVFRLMSINWVMCMIGVRIALWEPIRCYSSIHWCVNWIVVIAWVVRRVTRRLSTAIQLLKVPGCEFGILHSIKTSLSIVVWNGMNSIRMWCTWFLLCLMHRKVPCVIGKDDQMYYVKQEVGKTSKLTVTISICGLEWWCIENRKPVEYGGMHEGGECVWEYEIEGFWSTRNDTWMEWIVVVITIFSIAIGVVLILVIALYIYANKHRAEKRTNQLNRSLVEGDVKSPAV